MGPQPHLRTRAGQAPVFRSMGSGLAKVTRRGWVLFSTPDFSVHFDPFQVIQLWQGGEAEPIAAGKAEP